MPFLRKIRKILDPYQGYVVIDGRVQNGKATPGSIKEISVLSVPLRV